MFFFSKPASFVTLAGAAFAFLLTMTSLVAAQEPGAYGRLYGGLSSVEGMTFNDATSADLDLDGGSGFTFGGSLGYAFGNGFRTELDVARSEADLDGIFTENVQTFVPCGEISNSPCLNGTVDAEYEGLTAFAMAFYDFTSGSSLTPYLGFGIGLLDADLEATTPGALNDAATVDFGLLDGSDTELAYRIAAGVGYDAGAFDILLDYSWTRSGKLALDGQGAFTTFGFNKRVNAHSFTLGVRYAF
jgi:opacity protein-like surface antigen